MNPSPQRRLHRPIAAIVVVLAFLALPAGASPRGWSFFPSPLNLLSAIWEELGAVVDPGGQPSDYGSTFDPGGRPAPGIVVGNYGAVADPSGQPNENGGSDLGSTFDPSGQPNH